MVDSLNERRAGVVVNKTGALIGQGRVVLVTILRAQLKGQTQRDSSRSVDNNRESTMHKTTTKRAQDNSCRHTPLLSGARTCQGRVTFVIASVKGNICHNAASSA